MQQQRPEARPRRGDALDAGWGWMLRWLFGPPRPATVRRAPGDERIYLAPF